MIQFTIRQICNQTALPVVTVCGNQELSAVYVANIQNRMWSHESRAIDPRILRICTCQRDNFCSAVTEHTGFRFHRE